MSYEKYLPLVPLILGIASIFLGSIILLYSWIAALGWVSIALGGFGLLCATGQLRYSDNTYLVAAAVLCVFGLLLTIATMIGTTALIAQQNEEYEMLAAQTEPMPADNIIVHVAPGAPIHIEATAPEGLDVAILQ